MITRSLAPTIRRFANAVVSLTRNAASSYNSQGVLVPGAATTTAGVRVHLERPARPGDLLKLPEGERVNRSCSVWSSVELRHRDRITCADGEVFEVQAVEPWFEVAGFWRAVGTKVQQ